MINKYKLVVDTTDLDNSDNVASYLRSSDGTLLTHTTIGSKEALDVNVENVVTVTATDLDIRNLSHAQDSVSLGNGTSPLTSTTIGGDVALDVFTINPPNQTMETTSVSVLVTATDLVATDLATRKTLLVQNTGNRAIYIGKNNTVTVANGIELIPGAAIQIDVGPGVNVHAISSSGTQVIRVMEIG